MLRGILDRFNVRYERDVEAALDDDFPGESGQGSAGQPRRLSHPALEAQVAAQRAGEGSGSIESDPYDSQGAEDPPQPAAQLPATGDEGGDVVPPEGEPAPSEPEQRYEIGGRLRTPAEADEAFQHSRAEVDKWRQKAIEAEAQARAAAQYAEAYAQQNSGQAQEPEADPFRERLEDAGIPPEELDRYLDRRLEQTFSSMGQEMQAQRSAQMEAEQRVAESFEGFSRPKLDAFMEANQGLKSVYEAAVAANLESGLALGWQVMQSHEQIQGFGEAPAGETPPAVQSKEPAAPGSRRATPPTQQKVGTPAPGTGKADTQKLLARAEEEGFDTDVGTRALRSRFGGSLHPGLALPE